MSGVNAAAVASLLKTGDIVLFGRRGLVPGMVSWFHRSPWAHVGLVLRRPDDPEPLLWEARGDGPRRGTVLVQLTARIADFPGKISARCLNRALSATECARLEALRVELASRAQQSGLLDLMGAGDDGWLGAKPEHLGCPTDGELVAEAYQHLGLLDDVERGGRLPSRYRPGQFAEGYDLALKNGYALGSEIVLRDPDGAVGWPTVSPQIA
jgi:hypothetical protein